MKREKIISIISLLVGLMFLISGTTKSLSIRSFVDIISQYGIEVPFFAPLIVMAEVVIGLMLVLGIFEKYVALAGGMVVIVFTLIYAYGYAFIGIIDCGCFGEIEQLNMSPTMTFIRNAILLVLLFFIWRSGSNNCNLTTQAMAVSLSVIAVSAFMSGYSYREAVDSGIIIKHIAEPVKNTSLGNMVSTSKDSTYWVFAFSYTCPHCANSIEHLNKYEKLGIVDTVIGLALVNPAAEEAFRKHFKPSFSIKNVMPTELFNLTNTFPKSYYIRNDSIIIEIEGTLPNGILLKENYGL